MPGRRVSHRWIDGGSPPARFAYLVSPAAEPPVAGILLLHEAFGLNTDMQALAGRLAGRGYAVLVPDLYWRGPEHLAGYDERTKAIAMLKTLPDEQVLEDARRGLDLLERETRGAPLGVAGLRIGGRYALLVAAREPGRVRAAVSFYGAGIDGGTISPLWTIDALGQIESLRTPMLLFFVGDDPTIPASEVETIEARLRRAGARHEIVRYPGVKPGFVFPGRDTYRAGEAADAGDRMGRFLDDALASAPPTAT
jgi:carboxymethylenebutenolidase